MPAYHYTAMNSAGKEQKGVLEAENEKSARQSLRDGALTPLSVRLVQEKKSFFSRAHRLSSYDVAIFTRQFSTLLAAGMPIEAALGAAAEQNEKSYLKGILFSVRSKVVEGHSLAAALREHPQSFSTLFCATVAAGEKSGHLDKVLLRLADYTEQQAKMRQKLQTALIYPTMIVLVAFGIVGFLLEYVVPKMIGVYANLHQTLPLLTRILIATSDFIKNEGLYIVLVLGAIFLLWLRAYRRNVEFRERTHRFLLRLPYLAEPIKTANTARFARTLAILSASGVPVLEAMTIASQLLTSIPIRKAVEVAVIRVREGGSIHLALKKTTYFSPMSVHMMASGEASGQLENMLERVAEAQENEIIRLIDVGLALFEPAIILLMGAIVLFIVLAVLLPIFELNQFA